MGASRATDDEVVEPFEPDDRPCYGWRRLEIKIARARQREEIAEIMSLPDLAETPAEGLALEQLGLGEMFLLADEMIESESLRNLKPAMRAFLAISERSAVRAGFLPPPRGPGRPRKVR